MLNGRNSPADRTLASSAYLKFIHIPRDVRGLGQYSVFKLDSGKEATRCNTLSPFAYYAVSPHT